METVRFRRALIPTALAGCSFLATVLLLEVLLRNVPATWPRGVYGAARFSSDLQLTVHAAPAIYNETSWNRRVPNNDGFLDVDHAVTKPPGVTRVGFFGDSYVEALQVPLEDTFFRRLPTEVSGRAIEAFAFGISGWGTLHSLMAYRVLGPRYDLDYVIYLFLGNDPGDHFYKVRRDRDASAEISDDGTGFVIRTSQRRTESLFERTRRFLERNLMLARIIRVQLESLLVKIAQRREASAPIESRVPNQNDYPSTWPPALLDEAKTLSRRILVQFRDEVAAGGRHFSVLYVPRGDDDLEGKLTPEDSWLPWLSETCAELRIPLLNPLDFLGREHAAGVTIYDDHWSVAGHERIASFIAAHLADAFAAEQKRSRGENLN